MKKRILLVEDEMALRLLYEEELSLAGYEVTAVAEGEAALVALTAADFNLIVTDILMPGKNGIDFIAAILGLRKDIPIIINSAYEGYKEDFMTWAADAYVIKSASLDELKWKISQFMGSDAGIEKRLDQPVVSHRPQRTRQAPRRFPDGRHAGQRDGMLARHGGC